jgi:hypothetical protein
MDLKEVAKLTDETLFHIEEYSEKHSFKASISKYDEQMESFKQEYEDIQRLIETAEEYNDFPKFIDLNSQLNQ